MRLDDPAGIKLQRREAMITLVACAAFIGGAAAAYLEPRVALFLYAGVPIARLLDRAWL